MLDRSPVPVRILRWMMRLGALAALFSLILEFGFPVGDFLGVLHAIDFAVVGLIIADVLVRFFAASDRRRHFRRHWLEFMLLALFAAEALGVLLLARGAMFSRLYVVGAQAYLLATLILSLVRTHERLTRFLARPAWMLLGSFLLLIAVGTFLLSVPAARAPGAAPWSFQDALFTATSAACVTGLVVRDVGADLSFRGQAIVLLLIQFGGLGLVTMMLCITYLQQRALRMRQMALVRDLLNVEGLGNLGRFLAYTVAITLLAELAGAAVLYAARDGEVGERLWWAVFHSVSAFCNAGFALSPDSLRSHAGSVPICLTVIVLVVAGGLGFPVLLDLLRFPVDTIPFVRRWRWTLGGHGLVPGSRLRLHTKLVLVTTAILIVAGAVTFTLTESGGEALEGQGFGRRILSSVFQSVAARTAGFSTVDVASLQLPTLLILMMFMAIGASPVSTGGGMKTSSVAVLFLTLRSMLRNREPVEAFGRTIPRVMVNAAVAIVVLWVVAAMATAFLLAVTQKGIGFADLLFESVSAVSTVGLSTGVTKQLNGVGSGILCAAMLVGRVGPLAILWAVMSRPPALRYEYPEEAIVVS